jgi:hypothetical protein
MRLFVDITSHGWGHLSQVAPISEALRQYFSDLELVVRTGINPDVVARRLRCITYICPSDTDFGLIMHGALAVDREATLCRYQNIHSHLDRHLDRIAGEIVDSGCGAVLSNVGYLAIAAAKRAGVPSIACSSLNWSDLFQAYCGDLPGARVIVDEMDAAYSSADLFVRLAPGMPMPRMATHQVSRPIARVGENRRPALESLARVPVGSRVILCAFGGMLPSEPPPFVREPKGLVVLGPAAWSEYGAIPVNQIDLPYEDILASVDGIVTKPGYGVVAELGCAGIPAILVSRGDWPEEPHLIRWLSNYGHFVLLNNMAELTAASVKLLLKQCVNSGESAAKPGGEHDVARAIAVQLAQSYGT